MRRATLFGLVMLVAGVLAGCAGKATQNSTGASPMGQLAVAPSTLNFGNVQMGGSAAQNGTLTANTTRITVSSAAWSGQGYSVSGISFPVTIGAGQSVPFTVTFTPQEAGNSNGSISFVSNAGNAATATFVGVGLQPQQHSVGLSWEPSTSQVLGYNVYRGTQSGGPYSTKLNSLPQPGNSFNDSAVQSGQTYFYVATSISTSQVESGYSNETEAIIP